MNYVESSLPAGLTIAEYRAARPRHEHHSFLRAVVRRVRNR